MAGSQFVWIPEHPTDGEETIELGVTVSSLTEWPVQTAHRLESFGGRRVTTPMRRRTMVRITADAITDASVVRQLYTLESFLLRGGSCAFHRDNTYRFERFTYYMPAKGATQLTGLVSRGPQDDIVYSGQEIVLEAWHPNNVHLVEYTRANGLVINGVLSIHDAIRYDWGARGVIVLGVRQRDCYPALRLPAGVDQLQMIQPVGNRYYHRLDVTLEHVPDQGLIAGL